MANTYVDWATFQATGGLNLGTGTAYLKRIVALSENVSREVDRYCDRQFFYIIRTLDFNGDGSTSMIVPDVIAISTLKEDTNFDGTFETGWATADYVLAPISHNPTAADYGRAYTQLLVNAKSNGTQDTFLKGQSMYQVAGTWGYWKVTQASGATGTLADGTTTTLVLTAAATGSVEIGHTLLIDDELVYVTNTSGTNVTVERGINGSTGTAHAGKAINVVQYPGPVKEAVFIQTARLWRRRDSAFANTVGMPETGQMMTWTGGLDSDVKQLLSSYRRLPI